MRRRLGAVVLVALAFFLGACGQSAHHKLEAISTPDGPVLESVEGPNGTHGCGPSGGVTVVIKGKNFPAGCTVKFGRKKQFEFARQTATELELKVPEGLPPGESLDVGVEVTDDNDKVVARGVLPEAWSVSGLSARGLIAAACLIGAFAMLGGPIFLVLAAVTILGKYYQNQGQEGFGLITSLNGTTGEKTVGPAGNIFEDLFGKLSESPLFIAIPLFTFAGTIMAESKTPQRLVDFARALFGWLPGGVALVALLTCAFFTAFTGASGVTIIALGGLLYPVLLKARYGEQFALGLLTTCGSLGLLFKPALPVYIYGIIAHVDADDVFTAALLPGILLMVVLFAYSGWNAARTGVERQPFSAAELGRSFRAAAWELPLIPIVLGGLYSGWFATAAEASAVTAAYAFIVQVFVYRDIKLHDVSRVVKTSMVLVGAILMILGIALAFMGWLTLIEVPQQILELMQRYVHSRHMFLLMLNVFLLIVGCVMEGYTATLVVVPLIAPVAVKYGIDPYHLAVIFLLNLEIAYSLPPVGFNLFLSALRFGKPIVALYRPAMEFVMVMIVVLGIVTYWPPASLFLLTVPAIEIQQDPVSVKEGEDKKVEVKMTLGGVDLAEAKKRQQAARATLQDFEKRDGVVWEELDARRAKLETDALPEKPDERAKVLKELEEVRGKMKPDLAAAAQKAKKADTLVAQLDALGASAEWRSNLDPDVNQHGLVFSTAELKPGDHEITVTATGEHAHVAQEKIIVHVAKKD
ncbi:MAG TPA: TRAP transporter large permease subunit [Planctomycetota bacterium]|nr:TRAP transporter large permease subunit [Planctomycetota bacterium]